MMAKEKFPVLNRWSGEVQFTAKITVTPDMLPSAKLGWAVKWAIKNKANLSGANLTRADLTRADLTGANLTRANLTGADLWGANLTRANLSGANLTRANLSGANLSGANLTGADLTGTNLTGTDLTGANLTRANLTGADLWGANLTRADLTRADLTGADLTRANLTRANLTRADLTRADLTGADLTRAKNAELAIARTRILAEGAILGWKKCKNGVLVKLRIPEEAKRSHAFGRKCRAEFADVLEVIGAETGISEYDGKTEYKAGLRVTCHEWGENWQDECSGGIHFYITRDEAEAHL